MPTALLIHGITSSGSTWWRVGADLEDLGWTVLTPTLPGHGGTPYPADDRAPLAVLAEAVAGEVEGPVDLIVGHSLGALVALTLAATRPDVAPVLLLEDPPALNGVRIADVIGDPPEDQRRAVLDPDGEVARILEEHPLWSPVDARESVANMAAVDVPALGAAVADAVWDLPALIAASPVPVHLLVAMGESSAFGGPERDEVEASLGPDRVTAVGSGHSIHRDRPGLWLETALRVAGVPR